jgi:hypothetical protein
MVTTGKVGDRQGSAVKQSNPTVTSHQMVFFTSFLPPTLLLAPLLEPALASEAGFGDLQKLRGDPCALFLAPTVTQRAGREALELCLVLCRSGGLQ